MTNVVQNGRPGRDWTSAGDVTKAVAVGMGPAGIVTAIFVAPAVAVGYVASRLYSSMFSSKKDEKEEDEEKRSSQQ